MNYPCYNCGQSYIATETGYYCSHCGDMGYAPLGYKDIFEQVSQARTMGALREQERKSASRLDRHTKRASDDN